jgi:tetratricopeptide (TPR) repeat protein
VTLHTIGATRTRVDDFIGARTYLAEALELAEFPSTESFAVGTDLATNEFFAGNPETALRLFVDLLSTHGARNSALVSTPTEDLTENNIASALVNMAQCLVALGRYDEARVQGNEALEFARASQLDVHVAISLQHLAMAAIRPLDEGRRTPTQYAGAARLLGFVGARCNALGTEAMGSEYDSALALVREAVGADELARLMSAGAKMTRDEAIAQARALE